MPWPAPKGRKKPPPTSERFFNLSFAERYLFFGCFLRLGRALEGGIGREPWILDSLAIEQFGNAQDLKAGILVAKPRDLIEPSFGGLFQHRLGRRLHGNQHSDLGLLTLDDAAQVADMR